MAQGAAAAVSAAPSMPPACRNEVRAARVVAAPGAFTASHRIASIRDWRSRGLTWCRCPRSRPRPSYARAVDGRAWCPMDRRLRGEVLAPCRRRVDRPSSPLVSQRRRPSRVDGGIGARRWFRGRWRGALREVTRRRSERGPRARTGADVAAKPRASPRPSRERVRAPGIVPIYVATDVELARGAPAGDGLPQGNERTSQPARGPRDRRL